MSTKHTKCQRIAGLERQLAESLAGQTCIYRFATEVMGTVKTEHLASSAVRGKAGRSHHGQQAFSRNAADSVSSVRGRDGPLSV
jgi:hypothetical protein